VSAKSTLSTNAWTRLLLIESNPDARENHASALRTAGYDVTAIAALPSLDEVSAAHLIMADEASYDWLRGQPTAFYPTVIVLTDDVKAGVSACLAGAADWLPVRGDVGYLLDVVSEACRGLR
jgi:hypothetical protein